MTIALNLSPSPVLATTPTMIPAAAQVAATFSIWPEPSCSAATSLRQPIAVSRRRNDTANVTTVAQNTDRIGEKPSTMNTTIETSETKWYQ